MFPDEAIEYGGIRISDKAVVELDRARAVVVVKRSDVVRTRLDYGWHSNHPFLQVCFGAILMGVALVPIPIIFHWFLFGGRLSTIWVWALVMLPIGGWIIFDGLKRGFFLILEGATFQKKLFFHRRIGRAEIEKYLQEAEQRFGYSFEQGTL